MDATQSALEIVGLMAVLGSGAFLFVTIAQWLAGRQRRRIRLGFEMAAFFGLAWFFHEPVLAFAQLNAYQLETAQILSTLFWFSTAFTTNSVIDRFLWNGVLTRRGEPMMPKLLTDFLAVLVYIIALMIVMHFVYEQPITAIAATSGAVAFIIGYSAQSTLGELFSGFALQASRSIKKGDHVEVGDIYGYVYDIDWRSVSIYQYITGSIVVYPNSAISNQPFRSYSSPTDEYRINKVVTVEFSAPPDLVISAITEELSKGRVILRSPKPYVHVQGTNEWGIEYRMMFYVACDDDWFEAQSEAYSAFWAALRKHRIKPGMNHRDSGIGTVFDEHEWARRNTSFADERATLAACELLAPLPTEDLDTLIGAAHRQDFVPPEIASYRGTPGDSLIFVARGRAAAELRDNDQEFTANDIVPGEVLGLRAYVNGGTRIENVQCLSYMVTYSVPRAVLDPLINSYPKIQQVMQAQIVERDLEAERRRKAFNIERARKARQARKRTIVSSMSGRLSGLFKDSLLRRGASKDQIADALMAAAALIAAADGVVEDSEREAMIEAFKDLELFRFIDADEGAARFEAFCSFIASNQATGTDKAMAAIAKMKATPKAAGLIVEMAIAVSAADGEIEPEEEERLTAIRRALELPDNTGANPNKGT